MTARFALLVGAAVATVAAVAGCRRAGAVHASDPDARLTFARDGRTLAAVTERDLERAAPAETFTAYDPYYQRQKTWRALPMRRVLARGFGAGVAIEREQLVLRAKDGYTVPIAGAALLDDGCWLAVADADAPAWEPIGPQRADPSPFYIVWRKPDQQDLTTHPRPWQLEAIEIARAETLFPHAVPTGAGPDAQRGFELFRGECIRCHAINREGGRVGPDLNVPRSIVEYRPEAQIRAYIKDPLAFRYGAMPAHPHLTDADLDALVAYFRAMKDRKHDEAPK
jgi:mono/diheme cytochrome c family protein